MFLKLFKVVSESMLGCILVIHLGTSKPVAIYICVTSSCIRHAGLHCVMKALLLYSNLYLFISNLLWIAHEYGLWLLKITTAFVSRAVHLKMHYDEHLTLRPALAALHILYLWLSYDLIWKLHRYIHFLFKFHIWKFWNVWNHTCPERFNVFTCPLRDLEHVLSSSQRYNVALWD